MRVLIPILGFSKSGGYRVLAKFADEFQKAGHTVTFLVNHNSDTPYFPTSAKIVWVNTLGKIVNQKLASQRKSSFLSSFMSILLGCRRFRYEFDVVLANHSLTVLPIGLSGIRARKFYYIQAYEPEYYELMPGIKNQLFEFLSRKSYKLKFVQIVNSHLYCNYKEIKTTKVVFPGLDLTVFHDNNRPKREEGFITVGTIARTEKQKGTEYIIEAFEKLSKLHKNVKFQIAFSGNLPSTSLQFTSVEPKNDEELADYYRSLDVYVSAGVVQFGAVHYPVIESMACGTLVCTTPYYPATEHNCVLIDPKSSADIVEKLSEVLTNWNKYEYLKSQAFCDVRQFSWDIQYENLKAIIDMKK